jgi:hypothetical protein
MHLTNLTSIVYHETFISGAQFTDVNPVYSYCSALDIVNWKILKRYIYKCSGKLKLDKLEGKVCFHQRYLYSTLFKTYIWKLLKTYLVSYIIILKLRIASINTEVPTNY